MNYNELLEKNKKLKEQLEVANKRLKILEHTLEAALAVCKVGGEK